jgi:gluconolactonase
MYAAPRVIESRIFATLPEELRFRNRTNELSKFVEGDFDSFLEGPSFDRLGNLYCVDLIFGRIIIRVPVLPDGRLSRVLNFIQLSGGGGPDGIAVDSEGGLAVAHPLLGAVWLFDGKGQPTLRVNLCRGLLGTNLAYGGPDGRRLYITEAETGTIQVADVPINGSMMFSHMDEA